MPLSDDFIHTLENALPGQVRTDLVTRVLYSTDASIYKMEPLGVVFPRTADDLAAAVEISAAHGVPVLPRGSGSSLAGQAIGPALILDCSRHLNRILEINPEEGTATVEPGLILNALNRQAAAYGLQFGPDPASAERATLGGSIANNATGAHSILYGMAADHLLEAEVILADGSLANLGEVRLEEAERNASRSVISVQYTESSRSVISVQYTESRGESILSNIYAAALNIRTNYAEAIRQHWPRTWRCASGYTINYLLPWSASMPPQWNRGCDYPPLSPETINPAQLLAGSEGTLAVIRKAKLRMVSKPSNTILGVLAFPGLAEACDTVPMLLEHNPSAIELVPKELISLARSLPAYARLVSVLDPLSGKGGEPQTVLVVEFCGDDPARLAEQVKCLGQGVLVAESAEAQKQIWAMRKVGLGILMSRPGDIKPFAFIEDLSVPVEQLGQFVREMQHILEEHGTTGDIYAHASAGCLHIRPLINLKSIPGVAALRSIASQAVELTLSLGGAVSGEHGDGVARSEWLERAFGKEILAAFRELKTAADPHNILNPGKIVNARRMDECLRFGIQYKAASWQPVMDYSIREEGKPLELQGPAGLAAAIEHCNGAGVCRKGEGVMCPSFQATQDEMHSTRGRANLLRAMISGAFPAENLAEKAVKEALDLCLACKGCKAECPSGVDMAKLKYEFTHHYYTKHRRRLRDYLFGYIGIVARLGQPFGRPANWMLASPWFAWIGERFFGLTSRRPFPRFAPQSLQKLVHRLRLTTLQSSTNSSPEDVLFLSDAFTEYYHPQAGLSAIQALQACGCRVHILPALGAGRTLISKGFLQGAKRQAERVLDAVTRLDPQEKMPIVGVEPSEIFSLRDEYLDLFPGQESRQRQAQEAARRAWMIDEFLVRPGRDGKPRLSKITPALGAAGGYVLLHGHCYQKTQPPAADGYPSGVAASVAMLKAAGYQVQLIDTTCCGMAGAFGYESEHYEISVQVGELGLFPAIRKAGADAILAASGVSCQAQIIDCTRRKVVHPITLLQV